MTNSSTRGGLSRLLLAVVCIAAGVVVGYVAGRFAPETPEQTLADPVPSTIATGPDAEQQEQLAAIGYAAGVQKAPEHSGVLKHDATRTFASLNVFTSGHFPGAQLMDMDGHVLHQWQYSFEKLWPKLDPGETDVSYWRRVHLFENGDILAIFEPFGIFKLDKDSNLLWESANNAHHDLVIEPNGNILVFTRRETSMVLTKDIRPVLEEFVSELTPDGKELRRVSIIDAFKNSDYRALLHDAPDHWDVTHANSLKLLGPDTVARVPAFQPGRLLLSVRELGAVAALDMDSARIEWATKGQWWQQHEATLTAPGNILLFDNLSIPTYSRVLEIDPATGQITWAYGGTSEQQMYSHYCGLAERLPNGNTLITVSESGRVIEVTPEHEVVWEFVNPNLAAEGFDVIATVFDFKRLSQNFKAQWLASSAPSSGGAA